MSFWAGTILCLMGWAINLLIIYAAAFDKTDTPFRNIIYGIACFPYGLLIMYIAFLVAAICIIPPVMFGLLIAHFYKHVIKREWAERNNR